MISLSNHTIDPSVVMNFPAFEERFNEFRKEIGTESLDDIEEIYEFLQVEFLDEFFNTLPGRLNPSTDYDEIAKMLKQF